MIAYKLVRNLKSGLAPLFINKSLRFPINEWTEAEDHPTKGYAHRPGWHCTLSPIAPHLSKNKRVWVEVEVQNYEEYERPESQGGSWLLAQEMRVIRKLTKLEPFDLLSPDGFPIYPGKTYTTVEEAKHWLQKWLKQYEQQGYYSCVIRGRRTELELDEVWSHCKLQNVKSGKFYHINYDFECFRWLIDKVRYYGFNPIGVTQMYGFEMLIFETDEESHDAYELLELDKGVKGVYWETTQSFEKARTDYELESGTKVLVYWL